MTIATVYGDFSCPYTYALWERVLAFGYDKDVEFRAFEHDPGRPAPMPPADPDLAAELAREVADIRRVAPEVTIAVPDGKPNTSAVIRVYAAALAHEPERAAAFRDAALRAHWRDGADLSDPTVLALLTAVAGLATPVVENGAAAKVRAWREERERTRLPVIPILLREDGVAVAGIPAIEQAADLLAGR